MNNQNIDSTANDKRKIYHDFLHYMKIKMHYKELCDIVNVGLDQSHKYINSSVQKGGAKKSKKKWDTLEHSGVMFPPPYEPHGIPIKYMDDELYINPEAEEFITYYVNPRFDKYKDKKFNTNFFADWRKLLSIELRNTIKNFDLVNLSAIKTHVIEEIERRKSDNKAKTKDQRDEEKNARMKEIEKYQTAIVDGTKQAIDNYIVEPPTIFVGRGNHPLSGTIKTRLGPEDIILNIGSNMAIPIAKVGSDTSRTWGSVISDNTLEWIASWQNNVTSKHNYARFGRHSAFKMRSDESKYDLARRLKRKIKKIREKNDRFMKSESAEYRQLSVALFLIDRLALRIGNEKRDDEADTAGVTTLKVENIKILEPYTIKLDFLGKDSIRYINKFEVPELVYSNIKEFVEDPNKNKNSDVFDQVTSDSLNKYIKSFMKNLTSKVFRTYNASFLMQIELRKISTKFADYDESNKSNKAQKFKHLYEMANLKVAKLCNHQRAATNSTSNVLEKTNEQINTLRLLINRLKREKTKKQDEGKQTSAINKRIATQQKKMQVLKNKKTLQTESKTLSAGTSKINYIDPRITIAFLKRNDIFDSIDKFFNKTHQKQFDWAMDTDANYIF